MAKNKTMISHGVASRNRKATFNYNIIEQVEAGIVLQGSEVKSLRLGKASISEAYAVERDGEIWLMNSYIPEYVGGVVGKFEPRQNRKLLLHKKQINHLIGQISKEGATLVAMDIHFNERGVAKVQLGVGIGKKSFDKRQAVAERDWQRDKARLLRRG